MNFNRRHLLAAGFSLPLGALHATRRARAAESKTLRVGFQKGEPVLMAAKANGDLETLFEPRGTSVEWVEFQFGPPMLEAMRAGSIDIGGVGDTPPVFAQAAHADLLYIGGNRAAPESVLLPAGSNIRTLGRSEGQETGVRAWLVSP